MCVHVRECVKVCVYTEFVLNCFLTKFYVVLLLIKNLAKYVNKKLNNFFFVSFFFVIFNNSKNKRKRKKTTLRKI